MHPDQIGARIEASKRRVDEKRKVDHERRATLESQAKAAVSFAMKNGLRFSHIRCSYLDFDKVPYKPAAKGGVTVCYSKPHNSSVITLAITQCSPKDVYCRAAGRINAVANWQNEHKISMLLPKGVKPSDFLKNYLFSYV